MIVLYRIIINVIFLISPLIILIRLIKKKEDPNRFKEKFCFFSKLRIPGKIIWFHGASVGEIQSILPLLEKFEKNRDIKTILVTSNTLSSSKILNKLKFKKVIHQFFPIDTNWHTNKFLNYWKPSAAFFIDSEIWPNMFLNLNKKEIPITLLNGRITKKSFLRWSFFSNFSKNIFSKIKLCFSSSHESKNYLIKLGAKNIKFVGNLKFSQFENEKTQIHKELKNYLKSRKIWCASSTHKSEEIFCGIIHKDLKKKYKNLTTIIIPRHIERAEDIRNELENMKLIVHTYSSNNKIPKNTDIYIVDAYGKTKSFYKICKNVFLGGSLINHGGQNPLEATRYGCNILHGPNIHNFKEIYNFLKSNKISEEINNQKEMLNSLNKLFKNKTKSKKIQKKLSLIGKKILEKTYNNIRVIIK